MGHELVGNLRDRVRGYRIAGHRAGIERDDPRLMVRARAMSHAFVLNLDHSASPVPRQAGRSPGLDARS